MAAIDSTATQATTKPAVPVVTSFPFNPLTTTFTRPSDCDGIFASSFLSGIDFSTSCVPKGFHTDETGYYSACHDNAGARTITTVTCCPTYGTDVSLSCVTASTLFSVWSTLYCTWIAPDGDGTILPVTVSNGGTTSTVVGAFQSPGGLNAFGIRMVYQKTDLETTTMATTTTTRTSQTRSKSTTATETGRPKETGEASSGLSSGAKAAIGAGVAVPIVVVVGLALGLFFWWWRRRKQYVRAGQTTPPTELHGESPPSELSNEAGMVSKPLYVAEVPAHEPPAAELPAPLR
ncbi:hypothetical protein BBK36DRAFT_1168872 [Trichoderma citrinoviride]|uniref:Mid2 domain-containing protein n=1 Tax=Trichoderma citrinoviride TaxID=58853 RepID=A0A2T4BA92_9HYPO|nr:hypothetical protein BBK36DRAFT_1168872 [Trichoderma citrinoviride]PTB66253.1 hypothetical protein BBK36DRAFT_1168872 [Trichoderma citrinoviride]